MKSIIVTAFKPFNASSFNASSIVLDKVTADVKKVILDVKYDIDNDIELLLRDEPIALILMGEAAPRDKVCLEKVAINLKSASIPDNEGVSYFNEKISDGPDAYFSNIDVLELNKKLNALGFDTRASLTAGSYICNYSYYKALEYVNKNKLNTKVLFIHFPKELKGDESKIVDTIVSLL